MAQCLVCEGGSGSRICSACAHPDEIRSFCARCGLRLTYSVDKMEELFRLIGLEFTLDKGTCVKFTERCPVCRASGEPEEFPQKIYVIGLPVKESE